MRFKTQVKYVCNLLNSSNELIYTINFQGGGYLISTLWLDHTKTISQVENHLEQALLKN